MSYVTLILPYATRIRPGMLVIRLLSVSEVMLDQAVRTFVIRVTSVASAVSLVSVWTIGHRFSIGDKSGLLPGHSSFAHMSSKWDRHHSCVLRARFAGAPPCWNMGSDMSGRSFTSLGGPFFFCHLIADIVVLVGISSTYEISRYGVAPSMMCRFDIPR